MSEFLQSLQPVKRAGVIGNGAVAQQVVIHDLEMEALRLLDHRRLEACNSRSTLTSAAQVR